MTTTEEKLQGIINTKQGIKSVLAGKGVDMSGVVFSQYPGKISELSGGGIPEPEDVPAVLKTHFLQALADNPEYPYGIIAAIRVDDFVFAQKFIYTTGECCSMNDRDTGVSINIRCRYKFIFSDNAVFSANFTHTYDPSKYLRINGTDYIYMILLGEGNYIKQNVVYVNETASFIYQYARYIVFSDDACIFSPGDLSKCSSLNYIEFGVNSICFGVNQNISWGGFRYASPSYIYNMNCEKLSSNAEMGFPNNAEHVTVRNIQKSLNLTGRGLLTKDAVMSILNALCDNTGGETALSITLPAVIFVSLTDEMKLIAISKNWTIAKGADY